MSPVFNPLALDLVRSAPLDPTPDEARSWFREELSRPEYQDRDILNRIIDWFLRQFDNGVNAASGSPILTTLAAVVIFALLVAGASFLAAHTRRTTKASRDVGSIGIDSRISAAEYRRRAEQASAAGDYGTAVVEGFRALATQQVEIGRIEDLPQATAREVAALLNAAFPDSAARLTSAAQLFDAVLYGDHAATRQQAQDVLTIDESLRARR